jgi:biotin carboxyl carrier protein
VNVGDFVEKGTVLCIVEAMKLMNEIEAEVAGQVTAVFVESGNPVEYGERLFAIKRN